MSFCEIERMLVLSTGHLTQKTAELLDADEPPVIVYPKGDYGWFVVVPYENEELPEDLLRAFKLARARKCSWIMFDRDVALNDYLPCYEW